MVKLLGSAMKSYPMIFAALRLNIVDPVAHVYTHMAASMNTVEFIIIENACGVAPPPPF